MLEGILYFALGFLSAAMIALMISPALWSRAVALTRQRIENSIPLTLNEIQADKDQLRAEFAMSTRRLEMSVDELREKAAGQVIEISRKRDELAKIADESRERIKTVEDLEARAAELRATLKDREEKLGDANDKLVATTKQLESRTQQYEQLQSELFNIRDEADSSRIELVAKQTVMENLNDQVSDVSTREEAMNIEILSLRAEAKQTNAELTQEKKRAEELEKRLNKLDRQLTGNEQNLASRERDLARLRKTGQDDVDANSNLTSRLVEMQSKNVALEAKLAQTVLQMEALLSDASNDNVAKAMATLSEHKHALEDKLAEIVQERDSLKNDLSVQSRSKKQDWEVERQQNAILRERINDLAAKVTAMTMALDDDSLVGESDTPTEPRKSVKHMSSLKSGSMAAATGKQSLADRIRALQEVARSARQG